MSDKCPTCSFDMVEINGKLECFICGKWRK